MEPGFEPAPPVATMLGDEAAEEEDAAEDEEEGGNAPGGACPPFVTGPIADSEIVAVADSVTMRSSVAVVRRLRDMVESMTSFMISRFVYTFVNCISVTWNIEEHFSLVILFRFFNYDFVFILFLKNIFFRVRILHKG